MTNTNSPSRSRMRSPITAVGAVLLSAGLLVACGSSQGGATQSTSAPVVSAQLASETVMAGDHMSMSKGSRTASQSALYQAMQNVWQQHMEWTFATIAAFAVESPGYTATVNRLLANQDDIGNAIEPYYGAAAGNELTALLKAHITGVADILTAAKAGDSAGQAKAVAAEYANAKAIGDFLATANPKNWSRSSMEKMMKTHIDQTLVYATDLLKGDVAQGIVDYGLAESHMVDMANMLSAGVIAQFPRKFRK